ncbi:MAG: hypothetical protein H7Z14_13505 [Anaerolineae bacterium]|nr:hypothetical protein [Phycisphaerae bacterium]
MPVIVLLLVALVATAFTRQFAAARRSSDRRLGEATVGGQSGGTKAAQLSRMNSFALALLLGGMRGPLVMILWSTSESQKSERNLEDFDTKVEWIRMLQPEFDTVQIFQIWNKAYNISVQMASLSNKYLTIIDAIDYAHRVDVERPDSINIIYAIGSVYGDKLGDSNEKQYYSRRVREESLPHPQRQKLAENDPGYRRLQLDPVLDENGFVLPKYLKSTGVKLVDKDNPDDVYDGSELPFVKRFEPYPYGASPWAFAYNYRKRAQLLQRLANQKHAQLSEAVTDSRPGADLKKWGEAEWDLGRRLELQAFDHPVPAERTEFEPLTAELDLQTPLNAAQKTKLEQAVYSYDLADRLWAAADKEYIDHLNRYKSNLQIYESHRDEMMAERQLISGDRDYLKAMLVAPNDRGPLLKSARQHYDRAVVHYALSILKYYVRDEGVVKAAFPPGVTPQNFSTTMGAQANKISAKDVLAVLGKSVDMMRQKDQQLAEEAVEYLTFLRRADARMKHLPQ